MIFISHAHEDQELAGRLCEALERVGLQCWIAPRDVTPGQAYAAEIMKGLEASDAVVLLLSAHASTSGMVVREVERAVTKNKTVVPLRIRGATATGGLEFLVSSQQWIDAQDARVDQYVDQLAGVLRKAAGVVAAPPREDRAALDRERRAEIEPEERIERQQETRQEQDSEATIRPQQRPAIGSRPLLWLAPLFLAGLALLGVLIVRQRQRVRQAEQAAQATQSQAAQATQSAEEQARRDEEGKREQERQAALESERQAKAATGMVKIPAGNFWMGCNEKVDQECNADEKPGRPVSVDAFSIDPTEVTVAQYRDCVQAGKCTEPDRAGYCNWRKTGHDDHPINCVAWSSAKAYCEWVGKRLPTEAEWEKAARGIDGWKYPWGNEEFNEDQPQANIAHTGTMPVGSFPPSKAYGLRDMAGNVWEWVSDTVDTGRGLRGGSWHQSPIYARASYRGSRAPGYQTDYIGFRCAQ